MKKIISTIQDFFSAPSPLPPGIYHYQSPPDAARQYRLHLRVEEDGQGLLIINASTVLHLNQTAAEYAYHIIQGTPEEEIARAISNRYQIGVERAREDFNSFQEKIQTLIHRPDLDPVLYLDIDRERPYQGAISAPYRMDLALTYQLTENRNPDLAPTRRVDRELSTDEWKTVIDKVWEAGIPHMTFTGGEPTLRSDLLSLVTYAEDKGQVTGLLSDGVRFNDPEYLDEMLMTGLDHLMFVLTPDREDSWKALKAVLKEDLHTTVHITIHPGLISSIDDHLARLAAINTNALSLSIRSARDPDLKKAIKDARSLAADLGVPLKWDLPVPYSIHNPVSLEMVDEDAPQGAGKAWMYVEPDGDVLPAQGIDQVLGNLLRDDWEDIWPTS